MTHKANTIGLLFLATLSVCDGRAIADAQGAAAAQASADARSAFEARTLAAARVLSDAQSAAAGALNGGAADANGASPTFYFTKAAAAAASSVAQLQAAAPTATIPVPALPPATAETPARIPDVLPPAPAAAADPFAADASDNVPAKPAAAEKHVADEDVAYDGADGTVEIHVNDAALVEVLRMLSMQSQRNIIASKEVKGTVTANLYGVTVREALDAILSANGYVYKEQGNFIYVYTADEMKQQDAAVRVRQTRVFRCYYTPVATAVNMIKPVMSDKGEVAFTDPARSGLDSGTADAGGNSHATEDVMVVTDYPDRLDEIARVLKEVDTRPQQILIEATILRAALSEDNALGVDFQVLGGVDFGTLSNASASVGSALTGGITGNKSANGVLNNGYGGASTGFANNVPGGGLQVGVVKNNIAVFLQALESVTDTTVLANPKILALNKQKGEVIVGRKDGYLTTTTTDTTTVQSVEFLDTGTRLIFRPYIGDDGFIRMEIHPEDSSGGLTAGNLPFKVTTEVTSNVLVRDGHTIVIGGLFREDSNSTRSQIPILGNIPVAGALFRSQRDRTTREEVIILLTPHIVKDEAAFSELSEKEMQRMDQLRIGVRRGMMSSGRERLAEGFYDTAIAEMNKPRPDANKALWNLNAATNLNPKFSEAIDLKRQLTGRQVTTVDNSVGRAFVKQMILSETNAAAKNATPTTTRPTSDETPTPRVATTLPSIVRDRPRRATTMPVASAR